MLGNHTNLFCHAVKKVVLYTVARATRSFRGTPDFAQVTENHYNILQFVQDCFKLIQEPFDIGGLL